MAIRLDQVGPWASRGGDEVKIVWKGRRIAKLIFPSGKVVEFDSPLAVEDECGAKGEKNSGEPRV